MAPLLVLLATTACAEPGVPFPVGEGPGSEPAVAVLSDTLLVVAYESGEKVVFSIPGLVSDVPLAPPGPDPEASPDVAALADTAFVAVWLSGSGQEWRPLARIFARNGVPTSEVIEVGGRGHAVDIAVDSRPGGGFVVTWAELWPPTIEDVFVRIHDVTGQPVGSALQANESGVVRNIHPQVAAAPDGSFTVVWGTNDLEFSTCLARRHTGAGGRWDDVLPVAADGTFPAIATDGGGSHLMAWVETLGRRRAMSLRQGGAAVDLGGVSAVTVDLAMHATGSAVVAWQEGVLGAVGRLRARILDAAGQPAGESFTVAENVTVVGAPPGVAVATDGRIIFAWRDDATGRVQGCWWAETTVPAANRSWGSLKGLWR